jgi:hypothetical protein
MDRSGGNGMGSGLTVAISTWYHVFAIIKSGAADVYFDTSVTAANAPSGTTAFRRIGSFKTDASAHIVAFSQFGDEFLWSTMFADINSLSVTSTSALSSISVPPGAKVMACIRANFTSSSASATAACTISSPDESDQSSQSLWAINSSVSVDATLDVRANTTSQIRVRGSATAGILNVLTYGWIDRRGRDT